MAIILRWRYTPQVGAGDVTSLAAIVGPRGLGIASSAWNATTGILTITYTDATTETLDLSGTFTARDAAIAAQAAAEAAQTAAETAETNAATSETNAAASASAASTSATNAAASETAAAASETAAAASESAAATSETNAATSASAASTSATAAATSATNAATSETNAAASASAASTSETNAAASETAAAASEAAAGASETAAAASASAASTSEANAAASATAAAASAASALSLVSQNGLVPLFGEILWPATDPAPQYFGDTGLRLLSGASERAIMVYLGDIPADLFEGGTIDGFMFDFTDDTTVFSDTGGTTPAVAGDSVARVNDVSGNGLNSTQANAALRGKKGKAPKVVRNLLIHTEDFTQWSKGNTSVTTDQVIAPDGALTADQIDFAAIANANIQLSATVIAGTDYTFSIWVWADEEVTNVAYQPDGGSDVPMTITTTPTRFTHTGTASDTIFQNVIVSRDTSAATIYLWGAQLEAGSTATAYQRVGASNLDVTESGVQSFGFCRPDLSDDVLPLTVPAIDGDILIAGKKGTWIEPAAPSAGAFSIGPTTYTGGTPGILQAVGDITGVELIDKTLSASERERLIRYYQARGAKGLLVPGPELAVNGGYDSDTVWNKGAGWSISAGQANFTLTSGGQNITQAISLTVGSFYLASVDLASASNAEWYLVALLSLPSGVSPAMGTEPGQKRVIFQASAANEVMGMRCSSVVSSASFDNFSLKELRPEEDW
jgi:hypothetical protein